MAGSSQTRSHPAIYGHEPFLRDLQNPAPGFEEFLQYHIGNKHAAHWDQFENAEQGWGWSAESALQGKWFVCKAVALDSAGALKAF